MFGMDRRRALVVRGRHQAANPLQFDDRRYDARENQAVVGTNQLVRANGRDDVARPADLDQEQARQMSEAGLFDGLVDQRTLFFDDHRGGVFAAAIAEIFAGFVAGGQKLRCDVLQEDQARDRQRNPDWREFEKSHLLEPGFAHQARNRQRGTGADHGGRAAEDRRVADRDQKPARRQASPPRPVDHGGRHHRDDRRVVEKCRQGRDRGADAREPAPLAAGPVHQAPDGRLQRARFAQCRRYDEQRTDRG